MRCVRVGRDGQGHVVLSVGAGCDCLDFYPRLSHLHFLPVSLGERALEIDKQ